MLKKLAFILVLVFQIVGYDALGQEVQYFHKIEKVVLESRSYARCYQRIDSIKQTRRPNDTKMSVFFDRDVDFGFKHQRLDVTFNSIFYQVNFLLKGDSICLSVLSFNNNFYNNFYNKYQIAFIDTSACEYFLKRRNNFYRSSKNLQDLQSEVILDEDFAIYCGDGNPKTKKGRYIEHLVDLKSVRKLTKLLQSVSCEQQAYGQWGLEALKKKGVKLPELSNMLLNHIKKRDSEISTCSGCFFNIVYKPSKRE